MKILEMEPILKTLAREYSKRYSDLTRICFLFPNKRCGVFLKKFLAQEGKSKDQLPHILTISEMLSAITGIAEANKIVQLFILFNAYKSILKENETVDFDSFRTWGETVLSDFNTVDLNMVDPNQIFKNVKDFREITSNFLTEDQKEVIKEYFGIIEYNDTTQFWKNFKDPEAISPLKESFLNLWQILASLHKKFEVNIMSKGLGSTGIIYKNAVNILEEKGREIIPYKKIVVVGFNALTESERRIFKILKDIKGFDGYDDFTDFIWDIEGPILNDKYITASKFVEYNKKNFPGPEWLLPVFDSMNHFYYPEIEIISSPSITSQTKIVGEILKEYKNPVQNKLINDAEVAVILPDESLLSEILYAIPDGLGDINITMGYSLKNTPIVSLMALYRRIFAGCREGSNGFVFFVKDLKLFFSHPYSKLIFSSHTIGSLLKYIDENHKIRVNWDEIVDCIKEESVFFEFPPKKARDLKIFSLINNICDKLIYNIEKIDKEDFAIDKYQVKVYKDYVMALKETISQYQIDSSPLSIFQMVERLISTEKIGFEGEPLSGLQIMGTLETRNLDFKHVIILSMNEGIMPRRSYNATFIPDSLRFAYGLPPARYAEEIFGYYFYRLLSRANKVTLIYDGRSLTGMRGGESRYLLQLKQYIPKEKIKKTSWQYSLQNYKDNDVTVLKTPEILNMLNAYTEDEEGRKNLSSSSLNTYRECQVRFFYQNILNINSDPERGEYIDAITIGDVLHRVMMELYLPEKFHKKLLKKPFIITREFLENLLKDSSLIHNLVLKTIREIYYGIKDQKDHEIDSGVTHIIANQITELIKVFIEHDITLAPFNLYGCEISENLKITLSNGRSVNFRFAIDRLDEIEFEGERRLRIVDYKTGGKKRDAESLQTVFEGGYQSEQIFQLFVYAWILGKKGFPGSEEVLTEIYFVPDIKSDKIGLPKLGKDLVTSFKNYSEEFNEGIEEMIESIFTSPVFQQSGSKNKCTLCPFVSLCGK